MSEQNTTHKKLKPNGRKSGKKQTCIAKKLTSSKTKTLCLDHVALPRQVICTLDIGMP